MSLFARSTFMALIALSTSAPSVLALGQDSEPPAPAPSPVLHGIEASLNTRASSHFSADENSFEAESRETSSFKMRSYSAGHFQISVDGKLASGIHTIEGLEHEHEVVEYKDGEDGTIHTRPGNHKPGKLVITRSSTGQDVLDQWRKDLQQGKTDRKSVSVIFHNDAGEEVGRYSLSDCFPTEWAALRSFFERGDKPTQEQLVVECMIWKEFSPAKEQLEKNPRN